MLLSTPLGRSFYREVLQLSRGAMALRVLHPEGIALEMLDLCCSQPTPEGVFVVQEDVALPVAGLACDSLVPVGVLQQHTRALRNDARLL